MEENAQNVLLVIIFNTLGNVLFKKHVNQDNIKSTTIAMMSAQLVEITIEQQENVLTVPQLIMNFIMDFVFQLKHVELDNGLITTEFAMMLTQDVTHSTHQLEIVPAVFKDTTT